MLVEEPPASARTTRGTPRDIPAAALMACRGPDRWAKEMRRCPGSA